MSTLHPRWGQPYRFDDPARIYVMFIQDFYEKVSKPQLPIERGNGWGIEYRSLLHLHLETIRQTSALLSWGEWRSEVGPEG